MIKPFADSLPKYVINFDELSDLFKNNLLNLIHEALTDKYPQLNTNKLEGLLEDIKHLLPYEQYKKIKTNIDIMVYKEILGLQKIEGRLLDIPPIIKHTKEEFKFEKDIYITGFHINQTGWKKEDRYTLEIDKNKIINNATTKETGEHKHFNTYFSVNANTPIFFYVDNRSGNGRQVMIDLEYLEKGTVTNPPDQPITKPDGPTIEDISNDWDIAVVMNWEKDSEADIDLHGLIGTNHVYFGNRSKDGLYLNFDTTSHTSNCNAEILSVKGHKNESLKIYIHNYNGVNLTKPVNIKIYNKDSYGSKLLKEINAIIENKNTYLISVCNINLSTLEITELNDLKKILNGGS